MSDFASSSYGEYIMPDLTLKNYMEDSVAALIPTVVGEMDICQCEQCKMDILAYALNQLPPKYVVTRKGHLYTEVNSMHTQFDTDIMMAINQGAKLVGDNPRHD